MKEILKSSTNTVFLVLSLALVALTAFRIIDAKDFIMLTSMAFTYKFTKNNQAPQA